MSLDETGTERQNATGTGADSHGIATDSEEPAFSDEALAKRPILRGVPMRVSARPNTEAFGELLPGTDLVPFYRGSGELWYVADIDSGDSIYPLSAEARMMSRMSEGEAAHYLADKKLGHKRGQVNKVYFIGHRDHAIKIGTTVDVPGRLKSIQSCSPIKLELLAVRFGDAEREAAYHIQFREHRLHGEWFSPHPDILAEIERLQNHFPTGAESA